MQEPEINLHGWMTVKAAAEQNGLSTHVITNWMRRGKLPFKEYPELNGLRLVSGKNISDLKKP